MKTSFSEDFYKDIESLSKPDRKKVISAIEFLKENNLPLQSNNIKAIQNCPDTYRIRKGKLRIVYRIQQSTAHFIGVGYRKEVYKKVLGRV